ncbi:MAG: FadR family transcriptional regulator [Chloroflexi bacterium]|nr:MAG: FadR family transcriptional regulator [Chloroflexota bacterium]
MRLDKLDSDFLRYLIEKHIQSGDQLPTLSEMSAELGVSVGKLREELSVARALGFVTVRPRVGIQRAPFDFLPAVLTAVLYSLGTGEAAFAQFSQLRRAIESHLWPDAVARLTEEDKQELKQIVANAWLKLRGSPIHLPNGEHRQFHLKIYSRLENPFVKGLLEAYWEAYEASELTRFVGYEYWVEVWTYHENIVDALCKNEFERGRQLLLEHFSLLPERPANESDGQNSNM